MESEKKSQSTCMYQYYFLIQEENICGTLVFNGAQETLRYYTCKIMYTVSVQRIDTGEDIYLFLLSGSTYQVSFVLSVPVVKVPRDFGHAFVRYII